MSDRRHFLKPVQTVSPAAINGGCRPGELVFPDGFILPPGREFIAVPTELKRVWNEWLNRELGGGLVYSHPSPPLTASDLSTVVETGIVELDTAHGPVTVSIVGVRRAPVFDPIGDFFSPIEAGGLNRTYVFAVERLTTEIGAGETRQEIRWWRWKAPRAAGTE